MLTCSATTSPPSTRGGARAPPSNATKRLSADTRAIDDATVADFVARHGEPAFGPLTIVIPSYGEAANIKAVLREVPAEILGMQTSVVVVVDGRHPAEEEGATARRVEAAGHHVAVAPVNRGQGAALRVAYRLAREGGARYIVSLDADGQYDPTEIGRLVEPILVGEADFVSGSRRLGSSEHYAQLANAGINSYAWLTSIPRWDRIPAPANGLRA